MEGLCEGVAERDHASLASGAALHHHPGHVHQLDGALPALQRLGQVQHLGGQRPTVASTILNFHRPNRREKPMETWVEGEKLGF